MGTRPVTVSALAGGHCYLDANPLIYLLEGNHHFLSRVEPIVAAAATGSLTLVTGDAAVAEVMVRPYRHGDDTVIARFQRFFADTMLLQVVRHSARDYDAAARIRAALGTALVDALHLATALGSGCTHLITADARMPSVPGLEVVRLQDLEELPG